jgi:hypothetical protein
MIAKINNSEGLNSFVQILEKSLADQLSNLDTFLHNFSVSDWIIISDYCLEQRGYPNNIMVFTVMPGNQYQLNPEQIRAVLSKDLKDRGNNDEIGSSTINFLRDSNLFTFAFVLDKNCRFFSSRNQVQEMTSTTLLMMKSWPNASRHKNIIEKIEQIAKDVKSQGFNLKLFNHVVLGAFFAASIATFIARRIHITRVWWFFDQDNMHNKWNGIASNLFHVNLHAFLVDQEITYIEKIGVKGDGGNIEFDPYIRIPDHLAGVLARMSLREGMPEKTHNKDRQLLEQVFADNKNLVIVQLDFKAAEWMKIVKFTRQYAKSSKYDLGGMSLDI